MPLNAESKEILDRAYTSAVGFALRRRRRARLERASTAIIACTWIASRERTAVSCDDGT